MAEKLTVVMVEPHKTPYVTEIADELSALQRCVGGYIEVVGNGDGTLIICNEEGKLIGLDGNRRIHDGNVVGLFNSAQLCLNYILHCQLFILLPKFSICSHCQIAFLLL